MCKKINTLYSDKRTDAMYMLISTRIRPKSIKICQKHWHFSGQGQTHTNMDYWYNVTVPFSLYF